MSVGLPRLLKIYSKIALSTFGLLSRGKGIEFVIQSLPKVVEKYPSLTYLILGKTHPIVRRKEGEKYRKELIALVAKLHLEKYVQFYDQYLSLPDLIVFLQATDIYISSSINPNQAVSGTLSYALGTGRAVISTEFAQAKEVVTADTGRLVPIKDSAKMSEALLDLLGDEKRLQQMHENAYKLTRPMQWSNVAKAYLDILSNSTEQLPVLMFDHLKKMTDEFGMFQFANFSEPNTQFGYTIDDAARALVVCCELMEMGFQAELLPLAETYLHFISHCQDDDGRFANYISAGDHHPSNQNFVEDLEEAQARAVWALSEVMSCEHVSRSLRDEAQRLFMKALPALQQVTFLRTRAFLIKAFEAAQQVLPRIRSRLMLAIQDHANVLVAAAEEHSSESWQWFEKELTYNNAVLPESLLIASTFFEQEKYRKQALLTLHFLVKSTFSKTMYQPIGNSEWWKKSGSRSYFDQQPEDPAAMISALVTAERVTHDRKYQKMASLCFSWFLGNNTLHQSLYDVRNGGCFDGLGQHGVNQNQGAESLISYLLARVSMAKL